MVTYSELTLYVSTAVITDTGRVVDLVVGKGSSSYHTKSLLIQQIFGEYLLYARNCSRG